MAQTNDYTKVIETCYLEIEKLFKNTKAWTQLDDKIIQLFGLLKSAIYEQVHNVLYPQKTDKSEKELRDILAKYVIGFVDKKKSINFIGCLSPIKSKLVQMQKNKKAHIFFAKEHKDEISTFAVPPYFARTSRYRPHGQISLLPGAVMGAPSIASHNCTRYTAPRLVLYLIP